MAVLTKHQAHARARKDKALSKCLYDAEQAYNLWVMRGVKTDKLSIHETAGITFYLYQNGNGYVAVLDTDGRLISVRTTN